MIMEKLLRIEPQELSFPYELNKQVSCSIRLSNRTQKHVAFKVMTTSPKKYSVLPNLGIVLPGSSCDVIVKMVGPKVLPPEVQCRDKFLIKSVVASPGATTEDIVPKLFDKESGSHVQECKLGVVYTFSPHVPSPITGESISSCVASATENTNSNCSKMTARKLLDGQPSELQFPFELKKVLSCLLQLSNMTENHVFFKVKNTNPMKYSVQPNIGVVLPRSTCDVIVRMQAQAKIPKDRQCKDKFLIQSIVGSPAATTEKITSEMFDETGRVVEEFKLSVFFTFPSHPQSSNSERSEADSSLDASTVQQKNSNDFEVIQGLNRNESNVGDYFMKGIIVGLLGLIVWYLVMKMLPFIWSLTLVIMMLAVKMIKNLVSDSVEDWIVKSLVYVCVHFLSVLFGRKANISVT